MTPTKGPIPEVTISQICDLNDRLSRAGDLSSVLAAAHEAFDGILLAIRGREDPVTGMFAALVMAAASAADGRDAVTRAPSLPLAALRHAVLTRRAGEPEPGIRDLARSLGGIAGVLARRLVQAGRDAAVAGDRDACAQAAVCAGEIHDLLAGATDE